MEYSHCNDRDSNGTEEERKQNQNPNHMSYTPHAHLIPVLCGTFGRRSMVVLHRFPLIIRGIPVRDLRPFLSLRHTNTPVHDARGQW